MSRNIPIAAVTQVSNQFLLRDDILCCITFVTDNDVSQVVVSSVFIEAVLMLVHDVPQAGHPGHDRTSAAARAKFYWPTMRIDIEKHVAQCLSCALTKGTTKTAPILEHPIPNGPFDIVDIDLLQLPRSHKGSNYVLVYVDHFSRFMILASLPTKSAQIIAHAIVSKLICSCTTPQVLLSDNETEFKNQVLQDISTQFNIKQTFIVSHHPASNGLVERTNRQILENLLQFAGEFHETWEDWLLQVAASINCSASSSTGEAKHYVLFGFDKHLPYDVFFAVSSPALFL